MKRRNFIGGILSAIALMGTTIKAKSEEVKIIQTDEEDFYDFFNKFNGFPIAFSQKSYYYWYKKDFLKMTMGRQSGTTTFLTTLAAYKTLGGEVVSYFTFSEHHKKYCRDIYMINMINFKEKYPGMGCEPTEPLFLSNVDGIRGKYPSIALFDNWSNTIYPRTIFDYLKAKKTKVFWIDTVEYDVV